MHSQWFSLMNDLINDEHFLDVKSFQYSNELSTINFLDKNSGVRNILCEWLEDIPRIRDRRIKNNKSYFNNGKAAYRNKDWPDELAADYYTLALTTTPKEKTTELALAHANRAACFARGTIFPEEGYFDCQMALKFNYPLEKRNKLLHRKLCLSWLCDDKKEEKILETIKEIEDLSKENIFSEEQLKLKQIWENYNKWKSEQPKETPTATSTEFQNKKLIERKNATGRFIKVTEAVKKDEMIYREKAFVFVPVTDYSDLVFNHCHNCARTNCVAFPCYDCTRAIYCSPTCLAEHKPIHKYECVGYKRNLWMKVSVGHLALRCFLTGFSELIKMLKGMKECTVQETWKKLTTIKNSSFVYGDVLRIFTHTEKIDVENCIRYALTAKVLAIYLDKYTDFFNELPSRCNEIISNKEDWKTLATAILMKHISQMINYKQTISDIEIMQPVQHREIYRSQQDKIFVEDLKVVMNNRKLFRAIYPKMCLLNNSCDPNTRKTYDGLFLTVIATENIKKNEEIFNCFGPTCKMVDKAERQRLMTLSGYECKCRACISNDTSVNKFYEYICPGNRCQETLNLNIDPQWWKRLKEKDTMYCDSIKLKFRCRKCKSRLLLNPTTLNKYFDMSNDMISERTNKINKKLIWYYTKVSKCLGNYHELKMEMPHKFLHGRLVKISPEILMDVANIVVDYYRIAKERFGVYSLEYIIATTYVLPITREINEHIARGKSPSENDEFKEILKVFDFQQMEKSWKILPKSTEAIFKNALIEIRTPNTNLTEYSDNSFKTKQSIQFKKSKLLDLKITDFYNDDSIDELI